MKMKWLLATIGMSLMLTACASSEKTAEKKLQTEQAVAAAEKAGLVCTREKKIGSNMGTRVCRTQEQIEQERETTQREMGQRELKSSRSF